ncbi:OmpA family protein [Phenylobacterium sp.]|jgi:outer membrane protein OmpA-like peptidoglycan-associated protein|uniref:OmpA family protein n=1 Tax=Phenylobacterium sp. TaxID=1871053 RepID=UPI002F94DB3E
MSVAKTFAITALALSLAACATVQKARERIVRAPSACADQTAQIYFEPDSAELTREGSAVIKAAADAARRCSVTAVEVLGLADAAGAPEANLELSKRRAQSVTAALASAGLPNAEFKVSAAGQAGATTADGKTAPLRRRAEVVLRLADRK